LGKATPARDLFARRPDTVLDRVNKYDNPLFRNNEGRDAYRKYEYTIGLRAQVLIEAHSWGATDFVPGVFEAFVEHNRELVAFESVHLNHERNEHAIEKNDAGEKYLRRRRRPRCWLRIPFIKGNTLLLCAVRMDANGFEITQWPETTFVR
jgi:hypothetical protein